MIFLEIDIYGIFFIGLVIRNIFFNLISEIIVIFVFIFGLFMIGVNSFIDGLNLLIFGFLVVVIGMSFGLMIGYVINLVCDLGLRFVYFLLLVLNKSGLDWCYVWILIVGLIIGGFLVIGLFNILL